jgi:anti-anti-sigma regulatory factor
MLRITTDDNAQVLTLRLEGRLEGPWVEVLTRCWRGALVASDSRRLRVDLNGVTFIDREGKARLAEMYAQGTEFIADDLMTKAIVAEIVSQRGTGGSQT